MNVVPFENKVKHEIHVSDDFILNKEVIDKKVAKDIEEELTKGYIKLLTNFIN